MIGLIDEPRLPQRLAGAVELAQRVGEAADHRQNAPGLVFQNQHCTLHFRPHAKLGARVARLLALDEVDIDHVVDVHRIRRDTFRHRQRNHAAVVQADLDLAFAGVAQHHRGRPMHVVERQPRSLQRDLPDRLDDAAAPQRPRALLGLDPHVELAEIELRPFVFGPVA